jgi:hypothetical protein
MVFFDFWSHVPAHKRAIMLRSLLDQVAMSSRS